MKKSILSIAILFISFGLQFSQGLNVVLTNEENGTTLNSGDTLEIIGDVNENDVKFDLGVKFLDTTNKSVIGKKIEIYGVSGSKNAICWGDCSAPAFYGTIPVLAMSAIQMTKNQKIIMNGHLYPQNLTGITKIRYVLYDANNNNDSVYIDVIYKISNTSAIEEKKQIVNFDFYPNPAKDYIKLQLNVENKKSERATIVIKSIVGQIVFKKDYKNTDVIESLNISNFNPGIYFVSLILDKKLISTEKLIIRAY